MSGDGLPSTRKIFSTCAHGQLVSAVTVFSYVDSSSYLIGLEQVWVLRVLLLAREERLAGHQFSKYTSNGPDIDSTSVVLRAEQ